MLLIERDQNDAVTELLSGDFIAANAPSFAVIVRTNAILPNSPPHPRRRRLPASCSTQRSITNTECSSMHVQMHVHALIAHNGEQPVVTRD